MASCERCNTKLNNKEGRLCTNCSESVHEVTLVNELLMYLNCHRHGNTHDGLVKIVSTFYDESEIKLARDQMWDSLKDKNCIDEFVDRRDSARKAKAVATCEDILRAMRQVDNSDCYVNYYAANWKRLPKCTPEAANEIAIASRLAELEEKMEMMSGNLSKLRGDHESVAERVIAVEKQERIKCVAEPRASTSSQANNDSDFTTVPTSDKQPSSARVEDAGSAVNDNCDADNVGNVNGGNDSGAPFVRPSEHIRRENRQMNRKNRNDVQNYSGAVSKPRSMSGTLGRGTNTGLRAGPMPSRDFFVSRVHKDDGVEKIKTFLANRKVNLRDIKQTSHPESVCNSFKITVALSDVGVVDKPDFWETGIRIRKWQDRNEERRGMSSQRTS